jgi:uncharacterized protein
METITYQLNISRNNQSFYQELSDFTTSFLGIRPPATVHHINGFVEYYKHRIPEALHTSEEHYVEYLTMGVLVKKYARNAMSAFGWEKSMLLFLYQKRNSIKRLKPVIDSLRGVLSTLILKRSWNKLPVYNARRLAMFIKWMEATGEFSEEAIRMKSWLKYLETLSFREQKILMRNSQLNAHIFEMAAKEKLGAYTKNLETFHENKLPGHKFHENYIFCGRVEVEYHLNMFAAEVLNRSLRKGFELTTSKVILLPTCMSKPVYGECKAKQMEGKLVCTGCTPGCPINLKRKEYTNSNTEVALIPHSSGFSKFLEHWKDQDQTGLIGVACVLNLLKGGYEMQKLNIPSQCVFLDYCGCKKHWHKQGIATDLNNDQLRKVVEGSKNENNQFKTTQERLVVNA